MTSGEHEIQGIAISRLARDHGTPLYVYDGDVLRAQYERLRERLHPDLGILYSVKANPNVAVCALLRSFGTGAEVSSLTELRVAERAGVAACDTLFLGPGKSRTELHACVRSGVGAVVCESFAEVAVVDELGRAEGLEVPVALRVNPEFSVKGSRLTMGGRPRQFGIDEGLLDGRWRPRDLRGVRLMGVHVYMGTRILATDVIAENTAKILDLAVRVADRLDFPLELVDVGGGLGVAYHDGEEDLDTAALTDRLNPLVADFKAHHPRTRLVMELGRHLTAPAGLYVVSVRYVKESMGERFAVTDGGINHHMAAVGTGSVVRRNFPVALLNRDAAPDADPWQVTGPLCTPNDTLAKNATLPRPRPDDLIGVLRSGAYGPSASPVLFLGHGHPAEVLVHDGVAHLVRERDRPEDLLARQRLPDLGSRAPARTRRPPKDPPAGGARPWTT